MKTRVVTHHHAPSSGVNVCDKCLCRRFFAALSGVLHLFMVNIPIYLMKTIKSLKPMEQLGIVAGWYPSPKTVQCIGRYRYHNRNGTKTNSEDHRRHCAFLFQSVFFYRLMLLWLSDDWVGN